LVVISLTYRLSRLDHEEVPLKRGAPSRGGQASWSRADHEDIGPTLSGCSYFGHNTLCPRNLARKR
jgi:hypothetical protein